MLDTLTLGTTAQEIRANHARFIDSLILSRREGLLTLGEAYALAVVADAAMREGLAALEA